MDPIQLACTKFKEHCYLFTYVLVYLFVLLLVWNDPSFLKETIANVLLLFAESAIVAALFSLPFWSIEWIVKFFHRIQDHKAQPPLFGEESPQEPVAPAQTTVHAEDSFPQVEQHDSTSTPPVSEPSQPRAQASAQPVQSVPAMNEPLQEPRVSVQSYADSIPTTSSSRLVPPSLLDGDIYLQNAMESGEDLVEVGWVRPCCETCAKYRGRLFSLSGCDPEFPPFPSDFHTGCALGLFPFYRGVSRPQYFSMEELHRMNREPFVDTRDPNEQQEYINKQKRRLEEQERQQRYLELKRLDLADYQWLQQNLPELCPKSFSGYCKMRTMNTVNYQALYAAALAKGRKLAQKHDVSYRKREAIASEPFQHLIEKIKQNLIPETPHAMEEDTLDDSSDVCQVEPAQPAPPPPSEPSGPSYADCLIDAFLFFDSFSYIPFWELRERYPHLSVSECDHMADDLKKLSTKLEQVQKAARRQYHKELLLQTHPHAYDRPELAEQPTAQQGHLSQLPAPTVPPSILQKNASYPYSIRTENGMTYSDYLVDALHFLSTCERIEPSELHFRYPALTNYEFDALLADLCACYILQKDPVTEEYLIRIDQAKADELTAEIQALLAPTAEQSELPDISGMDGHAFEEYCAELLRRNGFVEVSVTSVSRDYGIDVLAEKDGVTYAIQCKCYEDKVGNHAVQEAFSGCAHYNRMVAVVMTNSEFTESAIETAETNRVLLWDGEALKKMADEAED